MLSVSSSRADVGILSPVWKALAESGDIDLHLFLTGMHCSKEAHPVDKIPQGASVHGGGADLGGSGNAAAAAMSAIVADCGRLCERLAPDMMLIVGDRLDMLPAAVASLPFNLPLVHIHGGEITEGAIDDRIRHALSKLAHAHCVSCNSARSRLIAMGEEKGRIHVTGAPGLDSLLVAPQLTFDELAGVLGLPPGEPFRLVTVHPETNADDPAAPLGAVLTALEARPAPTLFTAPNSDPGGADMRKQIAAFVERYDWARFCDTLGMALYPSAMRHAALMLGNSSSGIIEAGLFGVPVVNVGERQKGRERGANITDVPNNAEAVIAAIDGFGSVSRRFPAGTPYGIGDAGPKIAEVIRNIPPREVFLRKRLMVHP